MRDINSVLLFLVILCLDSCIDRIEALSDSAYDGDFVIDGFITDQAGPYTIKLYLPTNIESNVLFPHPLIAKEVVIFDDMGTSEKLAHVGSGIYKTSATGIRGEVGRKYQVRIELMDGSVFESIEDEMRSVGDIERIYYNFESFKPLRGQTQYGFRVYLDSKNQVTPARWRFTGTYVVETFPKFRLSNRACMMGVPDPPPCSGYRWSDNSFVRIGDCTCCTCWVNDIEQKPTVSNEVVVTNGKHQNIEIAYVPFDVWRFHFRKYMIKVEQFSLSQGAHEFWKLIEDQKEGLTSLFQPSFGSIKTNFVSLNSTRKAFGFFYASSVSQKVEFIHASDARIPVPDFDRPGEEVCPQFWNECDVAWLYASRTPPPEWE